MYMYLKLKREFEEFRLLKGKLEYKLDYEMWNENQILLKLSDDNEAYITLSLKIQHYK